MIDVSLWNNTPFRNPTAWRDLTGMVSQFWQAMKDQIFAQTGATIRVYPLGDGGGPVWLQALQAQFVESAHALGLQGPPDMSAYDLSKQEEFLSFTFLLAQTANQHRLAAGLP